MSLRHSVPLGLIAGLTLALTGCGAPNHGVVHDKDYEAPYDSVSSHCYSYDSKGFCKVSMPVYTHHEARYSLDLYASKDDHGWHEVTENEYQRYSIGQEYP